MSLWEDVEHDYVTNNGVKIHYVTIGQGPLVLMVHGFPDFWYTWRHQMAALKDHFQVVAIDQRGYNKSDQPEGVEAYDVSYLVADVAAVIEHIGREKAVVVGHDWGGVVAWFFAMHRPEMTDKLIILNEPHPSGFIRELASNPEQRANSAYARRFQEASAADPDIYWGRPMTAEVLARWVQDAADRSHYVEAFERSNFESMINYYKQNYPRPSDANKGMGATLEFPKVQAPVLQFHGLKDIFLHSNGLNNTWDWLANDLTLVTIPGVGHFVQHDAAELVSSTMKWWLLARR